MYKMKNTNNKNKGDRKKLSWIYRKKTKLLKSKKLDKKEQDTNAEENKKPRIIVRNVSFKATNYDIQKLYEQFGPIEEINFPKRSDGTPVGCCFIQFKNIEDASKAIFNTNKKEYLGRVINSSWAVSKSKYLEKIKEEIKEEPTEISSETNDYNVDQVEEVEKVVIKKEKDPFREEETVHAQKDKDISEKEKLVQEKQERRKFLKDKGKQKRARIVIRNLAFQATKDDIEDQFCQFGTIKDIKVLKRSDGKNVGCAFLQFEHVQSAAKAIHYANMQPLLGRPIAVDWAVPKDKFCENNTENELDSEVKIKEEKESDTVDSPTVASTVETSAVEGTSTAETSVVEVVSTAKTSVVEDSANVESSVEKNSNSSEELGSGEEEQEDTVTESDESDAESITEVDIKSENESGVSEDEEEKEEKEIKRSRFESHDVSEGKTVFLKNVPFSVKNEQLKKYMEKFGLVYYALVCTDPLTEYSKGTAFVKFRNVEDAEKCLSAGNELQMQDQVIETHRALDRKDVENKANLKKQKQKDSRNLYLVKEGVILAGSPAASGVSAADMAKRLQIEQWKSQILRNLNMFVSRLRLVIHNLPPNLDDNKLRKIVERHGPSKAIIREARVMRDLKNVDMKGVGISKQYAFVSFTTHEDALQALRNINNNPKVFTPHRRPIVSFSIENRVMINARQKRADKSRKHNPTWPGNKAKRKGEDTEEPIPEKKLKVERKDEADAKPYTGMVAKPGENKLRTKYKLKTQAMLHSQTVKKEKKMKKSSRKLEMKRKERIKDSHEAKPKQRTKVNVDDVNLDKLVNRYKNKLKSIELRKSKWYES